MCVRLLSQNAPAPTTTAPRQGGAPLKSLRPSMLRCASRMAALQVAASHTPWCATPHRLVAQTNFSSAIRPGDASSLRPSYFDGGKQLVVSSFCRAIPIRHSHAFAAARMGMRVPAYYTDPCRSRTSQRFLRHVPLIPCRTCHRFLHHVPLIPWHAVDVSPSLQARRLSGCVLAVLQTWERRIILP
jgi:hypothetical protein